MNRKVVLDASRAVEEALDRVTDRDSFLTFADRLAEYRQALDEYRSEPRGATVWENPTLPQYLEAAARGLRDNAEIGKVPDEPSWGTLAMFLWLGVIYE